jgi:Rieske Fe-S protein
VTTEKGQIEAEHVIVATNFPIINTGYFFAKMEPIRSYVLCLKLKSGMPEGLFYCSSEPYHTVRPHFDKDGAPLFVLVGGEDHKTGKGGDTVERYRNVERFAREHFDIESIDYRWSTQDNDPVDNVPYVGRPSKDSKNVYIATGLKGWGMSGGTLAGMILADLVSGQENPWAPVFDPKRRIPFSAVDDLIALNAKVAKDLFGGHLSTIRVKALSEIGTGEADIAEVDDQKVAAFKDQDGTVNAVSPNCTHMGCVVSWNNGEQSWDCPCHGSRFAIDGRVLHSPAVSPLERKK